MYFGFFRQEARSPNLLVGFPDKTQKLLRHYAALNISHHTQLIPLRETVYSVVEPEIQQQLRLPAWTE
ncbi:hypothetical protein [Nostoc sp. FACHB-280]|uniref:hypothetical protein n=1 Tax=Nostoc sp. FACHB-280 TaxID=2692839 RepID=UPI00168B665B|nr:hypothetical protein [Nostoc sp. FACHB-280]MBD2496947.1 hypothetical protein [Nostoc sp. FACHB-280]